MVMLSNVAYNGDFEEPWYWADYGYALFNYSFYLDKYNQLHDPADLAQSNAAKSQVPSSAVDEFTWRRERNNNMTTYLLNMLPKSSSFEYFYITMDDNAEYGFNIRESAALKSLVSDLHLEGKVPIYPGADEVQLTLLAKHSVTAATASVRILLVYRNPSTITYIPGYEGQPMVDTLYQQLAAAGGIAVASTGNSATDVELADAVLLVNNFDTEYQQEASQQPTEGDVAQYDMFTPYIETFLAKSKPVGFCDNRYANGADTFFVQYMNDHMGSTSLKLSTYAGWNTDGNTIGTVISNTILLTLFQSTAGMDNAGFNALRILEDMWYQASVRGQLNLYVDQITNTDENTSNLEPDLDFYKRYTFKVLQSRYREIMTHYNLPFELESTYFPWNRTFEIGFSSSWEEQY
jgi:hypothetical protein